MAQYTKDEKGRFVKGVSHNKGKKRSDEYKVKMSELLKEVAKEKKFGSWVKALWDNPEYRKNMSEKHKGKNNCFGKHWKIKDKSNMYGHACHTTPHSEETRKKISISKGGDFSSVYGIEWTQKLKNRIRGRDFLRCQLCGILQEDRSHDVHHIDYDKMNNQECNLITLCYKCHAKTNSKQREEWKQYFKSKIGGNKKWQQPLSDGGCKILSDGLEPPEVGNEAEGAIHRERLSERNANKRMQQSELHL